MALSCPQPVSDLVPLVQDLSDPVMALSWAQHVSDLVSLLQDPSLTL
jgi:hypothetical protein